VTETTHWLVSYRSRCWSRERGADLERYSHTNDFVDLIDQPPLDWLIDLKKRLSALQEGTADFRSADEVEIIYSAVPCMASQEQVAWWSDNV
jgi:hypothetical protein